MKKVFNCQVFGAAVLVALYASVAIAATPTITYGGTSSAAIWYLGPGQVDEDGYYVDALLVASNPGDSNPSPSIYWSTNFNSLLAIVPQNGDKSAIITSKGPSYTTAQSPPPVYNVTVTVTWDGMASAPFPVFINVPYSMNVVNMGQYCTAAGCDCDAVPNTYGLTGYITLNDVQMLDLFGWGNLPIPVNETLENQLFLGTGSWSVPPLNYPAAGYWTAAQWTSAGTSSYFSDFFEVCIGGTLPTPPPTSSGTGGTSVFTETQKYWVGTTAPWTGVCTQADIVTLYTNHGAQSGAQTPGFPATVCKQGNFLNTKP